MIAAAIALLALALGIVFVASGSRSGDDALTVDVFAKQYSWYFGYPNSGDAYAGHAIHVPLGEEVRFEMHSDDVIHAFWVPEWKVKQDIVPGEIVTRAVTPDKAGTYNLICAQACGIEHFGMRTKIVVEPQDEFQAWVDGLGRKVPAHFQELLRQDDKLESLRLE